MIYVNKPLSLVWQTRDKGLFTYIIRSGPKVTTHTQPFNNSRNSSQNFAKTSENIDMGYVYIKVVCFVVVLLTEWYRISLLSVTWCIYLARIPESVNSYHS